MNKVHLRAYLASASKRAQDDSFLVGYCFGAGSIAPDFHSRKAAGLEIPPWSTARFFSAMRPIVCQIQRMQSMNLSELHNTRKLKAWLKAREMIELRERNRLLAWIIPVPKDMTEADQKVEQRQKPLE
jgi:hypothetical protein